MDKLAQHVQALATHVQVALFVKLARQDMDYKVINVLLVPQELISVAKLAQHVQATVQLVRAVLCVKPANQDMAYKLISVTHALQEHIS